MKKIGSTIQRNIYVFEIEMTGSTYLRFLNKTAPPLRYCSHLYIHHICGDSRGLCYKICCIPDGIHIHRFQTHKLVNNNLKHFFCSEVYFEDTFDTFCSCKTFSNVTLKKEIISI